MRQPRENDPRRHERAAMAAGREYVESLKAVAADLAEFLIKNDPSPEAIAAIKDAIEI